MKTFRFFVPLFFAILVFSNCRNNINSKNYGKDPDLFDIRFELVEMNQVLLKSAGKTIEITFVSRDNVMSGSTGCNSFSGMWTVRKDFMKMIPLRVTEMVCVDGMEREKTFLEMLKSVDRYSHSRKNENGARVHYLRMYSGDKPVAVFRSAPVQKP